MARWWGLWAPAARRSPPAVPALTPAERARLAALGIRISDVVGRLRLVLPVGCAHDFTQTRAILLTGTARDQVDAAIAALHERGADCDCEVFEALQEPAQCVLWHRTAPSRPVGTQWKERS